MQTQTATISVGLANGDAQLWDQIQSMEPGTQLHSARQQRYLIKDIRHILDTLKVLRHLMQRDVSKPVQIIKRSGGQWSLKENGEDFLSSP